MKTDSIFEKELEDTVSEIPSSEYNMDIINSIKKKHNGKIYQIKVNEYNENITVVEEPGYIGLIADVDGNLEMIGYLQYVENNDLRALRVGPYSGDGKYKGVKLGEFLVKKAVEEHGCWWVDCGGTRAYRLYRKYGFVPVILEWTTPEKIKKNKINTYKKNIKEGKNITDKYWDVILMIQKNKLGDYGLDYEKDIKLITEYCDKNYKGTYDSKLKKYNVGDSIKLQNGIMSVIEDYDDKYFYVRDEHSNMHKILKDDIQYNGFSIQVQHDKVKVYRHNNFVGEYDNEEEAKEDIDDILEQEQLQKEKDDEHLQKLLEEKARSEKTNYVVYKPGYLVYNHNKTNKYRLKNGKFKYSYEKDAPKYTEAEADEILASDPTLKKVKVNDDAPRIYTVVYVSPYDEHCEYYVKTNSEEDAIRRAEKELKRRDKRNKIIEAY